MPQQFSRRASLGLIGLAPLAAAAWAQPRRNKPLRGNMPIVTTPYAPSGAVDFEDLAAEMRFYDRVGCTGAVWPQASSDVRLLSREERMRGMTVIADACRPLRVASILGVQAASTAEMLDYAAHAEAVDADAVIAMPPSAPEAQNEQAYYDYFAALARTVRRPVVFQTSIPGFPGAMAPSVDFIRKVARDFPNIAYVKEETQPLVARMKEEVRHRDVFKGVFGASGGDGLLYELRLGLDGEMTGQGAYGDVMTAVFDLTRQGRHAQAADAFSKWLLMKNCEEKIPGTQRYIFVKRGVFKSASTRPGAAGSAKAPLGPDEIAEIELRYSTLKPYLRAP